MGIFECATCSKLLKTRKGFIKHFRNVCSSGNKEHLLKKIFKCPDCEKQLSSSQGLLYHRKKAHEYHSKPKAVKCFNCNLCLAKFSSMQSRSNHTKKYHPDVHLDKTDNLKTRKIFECVYCNKTFTRNAYCTQHEKLCQEKSGRRASNSGHKSNQAEVERVLVFSPKEISPVSNDELGTVNEYETEILNENEGNQIAIPDRRQILIEDTSINIPIPLENDLLQMINGSACDNPRASSTPTPKSKHSSPETDFNLQMTPRIKKYLRNRKPFMQLGSPDVSTSRRARINLMYGKQTVKQYRKKVDLLQRGLRHLRSKVETMQDVILHLEEQNRISATLSNTLMNSKCYAIMNCSGSLEP